MINLLLHYAQEAVGLEKPKYATSGSSGFDLRAAVLENAPVDMLPGEIAHIDLAIYSEIPVGYEIQIRSRSGLSLKHGVVVLNAPGTIDSDYRGRWGLIMYNAGKVVFQVKRGDRLAQAVLCPVARANIMMVLNKDLSETERGGGGYGSTGKR
jgi:dUTP pyrophosphatase